MLPKRPNDIEWLWIVDEIADLSAVDVEQDGRRCHLRTAPGATIDAVCRTVGVAMTPICTEMPPAKPGAVTPEPCGDRNTKCGV